MSAAAPSPDPTEAWRLGSEAQLLISGGLVEQHHLGLLPRVVRLMPVGLASEIRRGPWRSSLRSFSWLVEGAQQAAEALRTDEEGFELHRSAAL